MSNEQKKNQEEVDLGTLFIIIGRGFSKLFAFIGGIFKGIFNFLIETLLFLKKNAIKIGIGAIIGGIIGSFFHFSSPDVYVSEMIVQPNFKSAKQLYSTIQYYDNLVTQKDTLLLSNSLGISVKEASSIKKFEITPIKNSNDIVNSFDELIRAVDTTTIKSFSFNDYKGAFTDYDYQSHKITVSSTQNNIFERLRKPILLSVTNNKFFKTIKTLNTQSLMRSDSLLKNNLYQVDSLRKVYLTVLIDEAKKQNSGTSIDLGSTNRKTTAKEIELFETTKKLGNDLKRLNLERAEKTDVVNVISDFQPIGYKLKGISNNSIFKFGFMGGMLTFLGLLLLQLNHYLDNYKKTQ